MAADEARTMAPSEDVAAIMRRAESLGIPAWRVATALNIPLPVDHHPPMRADGNAR